MMTQVMDPATSQPNWDAESYLVNSRLQDSMPPTSRIVSTSTMAPSTYVSADAMPSLSNPFMASSRPPTDLYIDTALEAHPGPESARTSISSTSSPQFRYGQPPAGSSAATSSPVVTQQMYDQSLLGQGLLGTDFCFSTAPSPVNPAFPQSSFDMAAAASFMGAPMGVKPYNVDVVTGRRSSQPSLNVGSLASQGIFSVDQDTPRVSYAPSHRGHSPTGSYNFPSAHSSTSSISSSVGSGFSQYSGMDGSAISDYSDVEVPMPSSIMRTSQSIMSNPSSVPAQSSMMTQFSSKVSSVHKKHVCRICEKRFARPSSLQTHVYSHTGEKPYQCTHPGCGRCFSVVSNLRRHQKIHRNREHSLEPMDSRSEADSPSHIIDCDE